MGIRKRLRWTFVFVKTKRSIPGRADVDPTSTRAPCSYLEAISRWRRPIISAESRRTTRLSIQTGHIEPRLRGELVVDDRLCTVL